MAQPQPHTTHTVKPPPAQPDQPVPMVHANTQNNHTTLIVMSAYYGSQMLNNTIKGFDALMEIYTASGIITEGQLYRALWPENGVLEQMTTIFGPDVVSYIPARDTFIIRVGVRDHQLDTEQMQCVTQALVALGDTALARRVIYLICATNTVNLQPLITLCNSNNNDDSDDMRTLEIIKYARTLHHYVPDIDAQLAHIATAQHRPMRHGITAQYHQTSTGTYHNTQTATLPTYIGRDGGVCTSASTLCYGHAAETHSAADRAIAVNPIVMRNITGNDMNHVPEIAVSHGTTVEFRTVLANSNAC